MPAAPGLDFSDGANPDDVTSSVPRKNKTERRRLQGLQMSFANLSKTKDAPMHDPSRPRTLNEKISLWLINEGRSRVFFAVFVILHFLIALLGLLHFGLKDNLTSARATFGVTFIIARASALVLHVDVIFILLPVCRNLVSALRRTPLGDVIPFDESLSLHKATGWAIVIGSVVHTVAHVINLVHLTMADTNARTLGARIGFFISANFIIGPLITGWIMWVLLGVMVWFAREKRRTAANGGFERFWYTHHLFIPFFVLWQLHGMFCMIKPDRPPYCSANTIGVFWRYWLVGGVIWIVERILREVRSRHVTYISKVIQHPSDVIELQIKKERTKARAGQYIYLNCPEISYFQWHPFTLTSAPEEDYLSVHIRVVGDFTRALARAVGCQLEKQSGAESKVVSTVADAKMNRVLPRVMVDGPFGTASEEFMNFETVLLVGGGIGVTPFASILKSIWYRMNNLSSERRTRLSKVYFVWVIRDFSAAEWFHSLLQALEEQDSQNRIEISIYLTGGLREDDIHNIVVQDVGADHDAVTTLRAPTHYGRPAWSKIFSALGQKHHGSDIGVMYCGPPALAGTLRTMSNEHSDPRGARFFFGKENF
ncbi:unnamed protein product [Mycena citricolor]|uniref:FAD-binding FR-type domain-containing protein n=1 Tax=Mycena citricolor TaxID=2018698 RepID=A0AAD2HA72_9AGAR|nr:unnamed protein product [Mycena citricolor]